MFEKRTISKDKLNNIKFYCRRCGKKKNIELRFEEYDTETGKPIHLVIAICKTIKTKKLLGFPIHQEHCDSDEIIGECRGNKVFIYSEEYKERDRKLALQCI